LLIYAALDSKIKTNNIFHGIFGKIKNNQSIGDDSWACKTKAGKESA
jgi:hypothetical protein